MTETRIKIDLVADTTQINKAIADVKKSVGQIPIAAGAATTKSISGGAFAIRGLANEIGNFSRQLSIFLGIVSGGFILAGRNAIHMAGEFERLALTFETLTGSVTVAGNLIRELKEFAVKTPLQLTDIENASATLLALGESAQSIIPILTTLGQASIALNKPLEQFIEVRNLLSGGVVLTRSLTPLGIKKADLEAIAGVGASGVELVAAFDKILAEKYEGLFEKAIGSIQLSLANLKDAMDIMWGSIGDTMRPVIMEVVSSLTGFFNDVRVFFENNKTVIMAAFQSIAGAFEDYFKPIFTPIKAFFDNLKAHPETIQVVADNIVNIGKALITLLIVTKVTEGLMNLLATLVLLKTSIPVVMALFGNLATSINGATLSVGGLKIAMGGFVSWIPIAAGAVFGLAAAYIGLKDAISRSNAALAQSSFTVISPNFGNPGPANLTRFGGSSAWNSLFPGIPEGNAQAALNYIGTLRSGPGGGITDIMAQFLGQGGLDQLRGMIPSAGGMPTATGGGGGSALSIAYGDAQRILEMVGLGFKKAHEEALRLAQMEAWATLELNKMKDAVDAVTAAADAAAAKLAALGPGGALDKEALRKMGILGLAKGTPDFNEQVKAMGFDTLAEYIDSLPDDMNDIFTNFIADLAKTLGDAIAQWGWSGKKPDLMGMAGNILSPATLAPMGGNLLSFLGAGASAASMFAGPMGALISGGIGWLANSIFNQEKPIEIKQPLEVHIEDNQFRLLNFFNFKGMQSFAYNSSFRSAYEGGLY